VRRSGFEGSKSEIFQRLAALHVRNFARIRPSARFSAVRWRGLPFRAVWTRPEPFAAQHKLGHAVALLKIHFTDLSAAV